MSYDDLWHTVIVLDPFDSSKNLWRIRRPNRNNRQWLIASDAHIMNEWIAIFQDAPQVTDCAPFAFASQSQVLSDKKGLLNLNPNRRLSPAGFSSCPPNYEYYHDCMLRC